MPVMQSMTTSCQPADVSSSLAAALTSSGSLSSTAAHSASTAACVFSTDEVKALSRLQGAFSSLSIRAVIGEGSSSHVYQAEWAGTAVCVKVLRTTETKHVQRFLSEIAIWRDLRHPNVCALLDVFISDQRPSMILEFMVGGSLDSLLHTPRRDADGGEALEDIPPPLIGRIIMESAAGLAYLHTRGVIHRDVKSANVLLDETRHAKLTDFGVSTRLGRPEYTAETGTYRQMAPEVIMHKPYDHKCDVYSFGILLWEILHRQLPFEGLAPLQAAFAVAMQGARPAMALSEVFGQYEAVITACWDTDATRRPEMGEVVARAAAICQAPKPLSTVRRMIGGHNLESSEVAQCAS